MVGLKWTYLMRNKRTTIPMINLMSRLSIILAKSSPKGVEGTEGRGRRANESSLKRTGLAY
uniref:Uncharacterized protein n=1 Tax=Heterorhabditis bacteriophora TaxID=37862 RepID=A0A1I7WP64_HETBA